MFRVNNKNTRATLLVGFILVSILLTLNIYTPFSIASIFFLLRRPQYFEIKPVECCLVL